MKNQRILVTVMMFFLFWIVFSCNRNNDPEKILIEDPNAEIPITDKILTDEQVEFLDSLESPEINSDSIILPNGMTLKEFLERYPKNGRVHDDEALSGPQLRKNKIVADMLQEALRLTVRSDFVKKATDGTAPSCKNCPGQPNGLAYGYNLKDYTVRENPLGYCFEEVFGLDCSGFLYHAAKNGIKNFSHMGTDSQKKATNWESALKADKENDKILMKDLGFVNPLKLKSGDIICWDGHIALLASGGTNAILLQSNGSSAATCGNPNASDVNKNCVVLQQEKNRGPNRGPRTLPFTEATTGKGWFGKDYKVLRLITDISGEWQLLGRCVGQSYDAINVLLTIPPEKDDEVLSATRKIIATGNVIDYDGVTVLSLSLDGEYNKETNILKANITLTEASNTGSTRIDGMEKALNMDDTGYFPATSLLSNGGCSAEWRLINKSSDKGGRKAHNRILVAGFFKANN